MICSWRLKQLGVALGISVLWVAARADTSTFSLHKVLDTNGTNHVALTYLLPKGWQANDQLVWNLFQRTAPMQFVTTAASPDGHFSVKFRNVAYYWYTRTSNIGNKGDIPPEHPTDIAIDSFKKNHPGAQVEILDRQETPTASIFKPMPTQETRALKCSVKIRASVNGVPMITKIAFNFDGYDSGTTWGRAHGFSNGEWYLTNWSGITGPEAEFSKALRLGAVTLSSTRFDPEFFQQYLEVCQMLTNQIAQQGQERLEILRKSYHPISGFNKEKFDDQMAAKDRFTRDMCDYASDQERFTDGSTQFIVPNGYSYAGKNDSGEFILSNDPSYNKFKDWQELQKVRPGDPG
jgi:hypothetical protein